MRENLRALDRTDFTQSSTLKVDRRLNLSQRFAAVCDNPRDPDRITRWLNEPGRGQALALLSPSGYIARQLSADPAHGSRRWRFFAGGGRQHEPKAYYAHAASVLAPAPGARTQCGAIAAGLIFLLFSRLHAAVNSPRRRASLTR